MEALVVPKIYKPFTDQTSDEIFGRVYLKLSGEIAREQMGLRLHTRLFLLGLQRVSNRGHAPFRAGEVLERYVKLNQN